MSTTTAGVKFPPPLLYAAGLLAGWGLDQLMPLLDAPRWSWLVGWALVMLGVALDVWALWRLTMRGTTVLPWGGATALVTDGPFRFTRNPIYLGYALSYAGIALWLGTTWGWVMLLVVLVVMDRLVIAREERHLREVFGAAFDEYSGRVRRWI